MRIKDKKQLKLMTEKELSLHIDEIAKYWNFVQSIKSWKQIENEK